MALNVFDKLRDHLTSYLTGKIYFGFDGGDDDELVMVLMIVMCLVISVI